jgi:hypothetical protein
LPDATCLGPLSPTSESRFIQALGPLRTCARCLDLPPFITFFIFLTLSFGFYGVWAIPGTEYKNGQWDRKKLLGIAYRLGFALLFFSFVFTFPSLADSSPLLLWRAPLAGGPECKRIFFCTNYLLYNQGDEVDLMWQPLGWTQDDDGRYPLCHCIVSIRLQRPGTDRDR